MLKPARGPRSSRRAGAVSDRTGNASASRVAGNATRIDLCHACRGIPRGCLTKIPKQSCQNHPKRRVISPTYAPTYRHHSLGSAIVVSASTSASMSVSLCAAESARRTRLVPKGTVGGRIAGA